MKYYHMGPWPVHVGFTNSNKAFNREMKRLGITGQSMVNAGSHATCHEFVDDNGSQLIIVAIKTGKRWSREQVAGMIAHEATHVVEFMRGSLQRGETLGSEAEAYLVQYITQECLATLWKTGRKRSIKPK